MAIVFEIVPESAVPRARRAPGRTDARVGLQDRHRVRRHADHPGRAHPNRPPRHRSPAARADREPLLAVPGDDGSDDDLGALGLDAPGRHDQPRPDDLVQPLRVRRDRRLAAPRRRGPRSRRPRLRADPRIAPHPLDGFDSASAEHLTPYGRARVGWTRDGGADPHRGDRPAEHDRGGRPAGRAHPRGGLGRARVGGGCRAGDDAADRTSGSTRAWPPSSTTPRPTRSSSRCSKAGRRRRRTTFSTHDAVEAGARSGRGDLPATGPELQRIVAQRLAELTAARSRR